MYKAGISNENNNKRKARYGNKSCVLIIVPYFRRLKASQFKLATLFAK